MKIIAIDLLRFAPPPLPAPTLPRPGAIAAPAVPLPIHLYPDFPRQRGVNPGDVTGEIWVRITAENGETGYGHTHWGALVAPVVRDIYAPLILGRDCLAIEHIADLLWRASLRFGASGISALARSAIDIALWDLKGKILGFPVYSLLGGPCRTSVD
jgi:L-rhamnonate dehydratase